MRNILENPLLHPLILDELRLLLLQGFRLHTKLISLRRQRIRLRPERRLIPVNTIRHVADGGIERLQLCNCIMLPSRIHSLLCGSF